MGEKLQISEKVSLSIAIDSRSVRRYQQLAIGHADTCFALADGPKDRFMIDGWDRGQRGVSDAPKTIKIMPACLPFQTLKTDGPPRNLSRGFVLKQEG